MVFGKKGKKADDPVLLMVSELKTQQTSIVGMMQKGEHDEAGQRVSALIAGLEVHVARLETVLERLESVADALADESVRPWYSRIFCR